METTKRTRRELTTEEKEVCNRLKSIILEKYGKVKIFADIVKINPSRVSEYINCIYRITDKTALKIQKATGISSKYLLFGIGDIML